MNNFVELIEREFETIHSLQQIHNGWDNDIYIVNDETVFRFPKNEEILKRLSLEKKLLQKVHQQKLPIEIPKYEEVIFNKKVIGVRYPYIKGEMITKELIDRVKSQPVNAKRIAKFLTILHSIEANDIKIPAVHNRNHWYSLYSNVQSVIFPHLKDDEKNQIERVFENFLNSYDDTQNNILIHGDLTVSNIVVDSETSLITGIIDFTDATIGDPAFDFAGLYWSLGPEFIQKVIDYYQEKMNVHEIYNKVRLFYGIQPIFHELLYALEQNEKINWNTALNRFKELYPY